MAQSVEEVIAKNLAARGGKDRISAVKSVRMSGILDYGDSSEGTLVIEWKRPGKVRMETLYLGMEIIQAHDGNQAWHVQPFMGIQSPQKAAGEQADNIKGLADRVFEGPLLDHEAKGNTVELVGRGEFAGQPAIHLRVVEASGRSADLYLHPESYLELGVRETLKIQDQEMVAVTELSDYRAVGGIQFPHVITQRFESGPFAGGAQHLRFEEIELDPAVADERFALPAGAADATAPQDRR
jgi:hypothetical protein